MDDTFFEREVIGVWIRDSEDEETVERRFVEINSQNLILYRFILTYYNYFVTRRNYGGDHNFTMIEAHVLTDIVDTPGITVSELATNWKRTQSALSQTVKKLIKWGYVERVINQENSKYFFLFPTEKARDFAISHKRYDNRDTIKLFKLLLKKFTPEELTTFFNVMDEYNKILERL